MDNELDEVARALFNGQLPPSWRKLAPATLKNLGGWMEHFMKRHDQYMSWVCMVCSHFKNCADQGMLSSTHPSILNRLLHIYLELHSS